MTTEYLTPEEMLALKALLADAREEPDPRRYLVRNDNPNMNEEDEWYWDRNGGVLDLPSGAVSRHNYNVGKRQIRPIRPTDQDNDNRKKRWWDRFI